MIDNDDFEAALRKNLERTLDAFHMYLSEELKLKETTVNRHLDQITFFGRTYLNHIDESIEEFNSNHIIGFLGDYYIRKVLNSTERSTATERRWSN